MQHSYKSRTQKMQKTKRGKEKFYKNLSTYTAVQMALVIFENFFR